MFELFQLLKISYQQTRSPWPFPSPGYRSNLSMQGMFRRSRPEQGSTTAGGETTGAGLSFWMPRRITSKPNLGTSETNPFAFTGPQLFNPGLWAQECGLWKGSLWQCYLHFTPFYTSPKSGFSFRHGVQTFCKSPPKDCWGFLSRRKTWCTVTSFTQTLSTGSAGCQPTIISLHPPENQHVTPEKWWLEDYFLLKWSLFQGPFVHFFGVIFFEDGRWVSHMKLPSKHLLPKVCLLKTPFKLTIEASNFQVGPPLPHQLSIQKPIKEVMCFVMLPWEDVLFSPNHRGLMSFFW